MSLATSIGSEAGLRLEDFDYPLAAGRIAQAPAARRGGSRLMVVERERGAWSHQRFADLPRFLRAGDVLVRNVSRVIRARLRGRRPGGGAVEILLVAREGGKEGREIWSCLARPGRRLRRGRRAEFPGGIVAEWLDDGADDGIRRVALAAERPVLELLEKVGEVPLPPYITRPASAADAEAYQTVYASRPGSIAAPTAGLHFTEEILARIAAAGVEIADLTLHVGPATFLPLRDRDLGRGRLGVERVEIPETTADAVESAKRENRRVVAVGTTTVRALEGSFAGDLRAGSGLVDLFIVPGFRFRVVDALITNFHLPRSSLLLLVAAFAGREPILAAYREAIEREYRFYSYGDAMLIL